MPNTECQPSMSKLAKVSNPIIDLCCKLKLPPFLVLDVGAGGGNTIEFKQIAPHCHVHAVEPRTDPDAKLPNLGGFGKFMSHNTALSDKPGPQTLYVTDVPEASSLLKPNSINIKRWRGSDKGFKVVEERIVDCETLEEFSKRAGIAKCDFLKIDTQGTELNILLSGENLLLNTSVILMEIEFVRLYQNQYLFEDAVRELSKDGFRYINFTEGRSLRGYWGTAPQKRIWSDTLFLRDTPGAMVREEILKAAMVLFELGYSEEAIWFMQDHLVDDETIALIANSFRAIAVSNEGFISRRILFPIMLIMRKLEFPGRTRVGQYLLGLPFTRSLMRNLPL